MATSAALPSLPAAPAIVIHPGSIVVAQTPQAGRRVQQGDAVHVALADTAPAPAPSAAAAMPPPRTN
jgi:hypothetical protein